jgi:hypothetical protein
MLLMVMPEGCNAVRLKKPPPPLGLERLVTVPVNSVVIDWADAVELAAVASTMHSRVFMFSPA